MPRGRKRQESLSLEEKLDDVVAQIDTTEETLKNLKNQKKEIEKQIKEQKKEQLYQTVMNRRNSWSIKSERWRENRIEIK